MYGERTYYDWEIEREAKDRLRDIEIDKSTWRSDFARKMDIWKAIAFNLNGAKGKDRVIWDKVMDLYHEKYK